jgi:hypothetical protein
LKILCNPEIRISELSIRKIEAMSSLPIALPSLSDLSASLTSEIFIGLSQVLLHFPKDAFFRSNSSISYTEQPQILTGEGVQRVVASYPHFTQQIFDPPPPLPISRK